MRVIFLGDVVGEPGRDTVKAAVPLLQERYAPDFFVVNGENAAGGHGITPRLVYELLRCKVDVITLGDHAWDQREILPFFDQEPRLIRPFNFPAGNPGAGWVTVSGNGKKLGVVSALGRTFMPAPVDNPVLGMPAILAQVQKETRCILVDFHAEATSEKIAFGLALDGQVSAVIGTHTHVQTADDKILPGGTAYLTDAGFCGGHDSVIGRHKEPILERYKTLLPVKMTISGDQPQADGIFVEIDEETGKATRLERIQQAVEFVK
ncbi:MAG: TIGR00282 family metallophosphoesterase [Verrucomicrobiales bacterium]|jgi:metallophosphoesterase (TIGR00282 family)|nr:TIGR00282 family metallophosphoesterase [Verrucomicrobiales bacterium]